MANTWLPTSLLDHFSALQFGDEAASHVDDVAQQEAGAQALTTLPSLQDLTPWDAPQPRSQSSITAHDDYANEPKQQAQPPIDLPSLESLTPWQVPVTPAPSSTDTSSAATETSAANVQLPSDQTAGAGAASSPPSAPAVAASGSVDTSSPDAFLSTLHPYAQQAEAKTGVPASVLTAIAANESGYGKYPAGGVQGNNNFFGIKGKEPGSWSSFASPQEGLDWVANMFATDPRYARAYANKDNADAFVQELANAGYIQPDESGAWIKQVQALSKQAQAIAPAARAAAAQQTAAVDQAALDDPDKWALCGPVAAVLAAASHGKDWTVAQAKGIATKLGLWDAGNGMHGLDSEVALLKQAGVDASTGAADETRLAKDALSGNTPIVSTDGHYFVLRGYDPQTGKFDTGSTGTVYRGGSRWLTLGEMQNLAGTIQGAAYMDNPASPTPPTDWRQGSGPAPTEGKAAGLGGTQADLPLDVPADDSTYGPFDPPGYTAPRTPPDQTLDPSGTGPQPGDFPSTPPSNPLPYGPPPQVDENAGAGVGPDQVYQPPENPLQWVGRKVGDFSQGLASGLNRASDTLTGGLNQGADQLATDPNTGEVVQGPGGFLQAGHNVARAIGDSPAIGAADANAAWDRMGEIDRFATGNGYDSAIDSRFIKDYPDLAREHGQMVMSVSGGMAGTAPELHGAVPAHLGGPGAAPLPGPLRRVGEAIGGLRDLATPGGAPLAGVVESDRYYHGTGSGYDTPNPATFDEHGLFGPGYYLTSDPRVAGSYGKARSGASQQSAQALAEWIQDQESRIASGQYNDYQIAVTRENIAKAQATIAKSSGPNVRAVDVPRGLRLLDAEAPLRTQPELLGQVEQALTDPGQVDRFRNAMRDQATRGQGPMTLYDVQRALGTTLGSQGEANRLLAAAGYDGITYSGGKRIPMQDEAGQNIEHTATMIFGDSLPKITNATSGRPGGLLPSPSAASPGQRLAGQAVGGAISGGYAASQEPDATPQSVLGGAALGAAGGVVRGAVGRRGAGQAIANVVRATNLSDPNNQKLGAMFERPVPTPATTTPWYRRLAQALTDDRALLYGWEKDVRSRLGANVPATDLIGDLTRINPDSMASQRLQPVEAAAEAVRAAGVDPSVLSVYLAHVHDVDIAQEFGQRAFDAATARGATPPQAQAAFDVAANGRTFSGGRHLQDIQASLQSMAGDLGADRMQAVHDAAQRIWDLNTATRDRLFAAGGMDQATHAHLAQAYPHYVTTDIVNHIDPESAVAGAGGGVSQRTNAIRELSAAGTASDRLDPLQSVVANTVRSERWIAKNVVFNAFHDLVNADPTLATQLGVTPSKPGGTKEVTGLVNGQRETLRIARPIAEVIEMGNSTAAGMLGEVLKKLTGPFKAGLTTYNPAFQYVVNPLRDSTDFFTRQTAYLGGPQHLPEVMAAYAAAVKDVATEGKWTQAYKAAGGSYERVDTSAKGIANLTKDLTASGGEQVRDPRKIAAIARDVLTLGARPVGERTELVPRVAAFKMASERGASPVASMIAGRNATIPFEVGGRAVKAFNTAIPFLNATVQAGAQLGRSFRDHPVATTASMATIVGLPALAAQAWNRSDPDRAAAFADVPDYLKRNGLVFMLPLAGSDQRGPLPNYVWIPLGNFAPAATAMNAAVEERMGESSPDEFAKLLMGVLGSFSPIKGDNVGSAMASVVPPGLSTGLDLAGNRDLYRGRTIASDAADRNAGALAKSITGGLNAVGNLPGMGGLRDIRPSQTEYALRDLTGAPGQTASAAANMAAGQESGRNRPVQDVPILGGLAGRVIRDTGGQQLQNAQDVRVSPETDAVLRDAGLRPADLITPVTAMAKGVPLDREQQLQYQQVMNDMLDREITLVQRSADYRNPTTREQAVRDAVTRARAAAADRVLSRIPAGQQDRLKRDAALQRAG